jgi:hypothetical protein
MPPAIAGVAPIVIAATPAQHNQEATLADPSDRNFVNMFRVMFVLH